MIELNHSRNLAVRRRVDCFLAVLMLGVLLTTNATAQTFTTLHRFDGNDGATPWASLIVSGNTLYGTTTGEGSWVNSTVFAVNTDGTGFTNLHSFATLNPSYTNIYGGVTYTNSEGAEPMAGLILSGVTLYGTAEYGGSSGNGTVFAVHTDGTGFTNLHNFDAYPSDAGDPQAGLVLSGNTLYGTAATVFAISTNGTGFTNLHNFTAGNTNSSGTSTNSDGGFPTAGLVLSGNTLFGTADLGGSSGNGTVFAVNINGTGFTNLHSFSAGSGSAGDYGTNSDGIYPDAGLILSGNTLYGTTASGGGSGYGTVFAINTDGTGFTNLHSFTGGSDGAVPEAGLLLSGHTLYGTTWTGGSSDYGTVFAVSTDGTGFTNLHNFTYGNGGFPYAGLVLSGNTLYGTTTDYWNDFLYGTVFSLSFPPPQLTITLSGSNVILSWSANIAGFDYSGYTLQSTTNLVSAVWSTNLPPPVVVNGQNVVTHPISGNQQLFRLSQ